jgi:16S rRNA (cytidine1402-2'-O)-methyltransferase
VASGLVGDGYTFVGYLPRGEKPLRELCARLAGSEAPVVAFESPRRLPRSLRVLAEECPGRRVAVCRELTKRFEEVVRGPVSEVAERFAEPPKGEITLVIGGAEKVRRNDPASGGAEAVAELVAAGVPRRKAADLVARLTGEPRNRLYRSSL